MKLNYIIAYLKKPKKKPFSMPRMAISCLYLPANHYELTNKIKYEQEATAIIACQF
jgi:hypothetical protein